MSNLCAKIAVCSALLFFAAPALAEVKQGQFRLFLDTDLFTYERTTFEKVGERDVETAIEIGPGGSALNGGDVTSTGALPGHVGIGLGYAVHRYVVPSFHFSVGRRQSIHEVFLNDVAQPSVDEPTVFTFMMRPEVELLLNPKQQHVVAALLGFDVRRARITESPPGAPKYERELTALGPVAGVMAHFFVVKQASLDLGAVAVIDFVKARGDGKWTDAVSYRDVVLSLMMGISLWP